MKKYGFWWHYQTELKIAKRELRRKPNGLLGIV